MTDASVVGASPYRLTPPAYQVYSNSPGETQLLSHINPENIGAMGAMLYSEEAKNRRAQQDYGEQLRGVNLQQQDIAALRTRHEDTVNRRLTALGMGKDLGVDASNLPDLAALTNRSQAGQQALLETDVLRRLGSESQNLQRGGAGARDFAEAGVTINPGQSSNLSFENLRRLGTTSQAPLDERIANINAASRAKGDGEGGSGGTQVEISSDSSAPGTVQFKARGKNPVDVDRVFRQSSPSLRQFGIDQARGGSGPTSVPTAGSNRVDPNVSRRAAVTPGVNAGHRIEQQVRNGRVTNYALNTDGTRVHIPD